MKFILPVLMAIAVAAISIFYVRSKNTFPGSPNSSPSVASVTNDVSPSPTPSPITLIDVAKHGDANSCWIAIEGKVYDVTSFIQQGLHPGGDKILQGCGKDATDLFNNRDGNGGSHSENARKLLPQYYIGNLTN